VAKILQRPEYLRLFENDPDMFWFAFSIICNDDVLISKIDIRAPVTSERLVAMKALTDLGCRASLRLRPFLPGISDQGWEDLIDRADEAGSRAISFEYLFIDRKLVPYKKLPQKPEPTQLKKQKAMMNSIYKLMGNPDFGYEWKEASQRGEILLRGSKLAKMDMTFAIRDKVHSLGWQFGISDPHWKELNDNLNCCGIPDDDEVFGKFSREQMAAVLVQGRRAYECGEIKQFSFNDWKPSWGDMVLKADCVNLGNAIAHRVAEELTINETFRNKWNDLKDPRGPYVYFEKALFPVGVDKATGDRIYKYKPFMG